jgi:hypothetical protein
MSETPRAEELKAEIIALYKQVRAAEAELQEERFRDVPCYEQGLVVLVPRMLFGKEKLWPARIQAVRFHYGAGTNARGEDWETKVVSYAVCYELKDGSGFSPTTDSVWHKDIVLRPQAQEASS